MSAASPEEGRAAVARWLDVSRETLPLPAEAVLQRLDAYAALLRRWQPRINLISPSTLPQLWSRHILDCLQLRPFAQPPLADLGSGAGLPGLVLAATQCSPIVLIEADQRKSVFLRQAAAAMGLAPPAVTILPARIEAVSGRYATVTARALAPLERLVPLAAPLLAPGGRLVLPKGSAAEAELAALPDCASWRVERYPSLTDPAASILVLTRP